MGHAYSSIIADFFARFKRMDGFNVHFLTGTDEHGLKIQRAAEKKGAKTLEFCDELSKTIKDLSKYVIYYLIELFLKRKTNLDINNYYFEFINKMNNVNKFNLDEESFFIDLETKVING